MTPARLALFHGRAKIPRPLRPPRRVGFAAAGMGIVPIILTVAGAWVAAVAAEPDPFRETRAEPGLTAHPGRAPNGGSQERAQEEPLRQLLGPQPASQAHELAPSSRFASPDDGAWSEPRAAARSDFVAVYDPIRGRMIVHGGLSPFFPATHDDAWALLLAGSPSWEKACPDSELIREAHAGIYDPVGDRLVVFGGLYRAPDGGQLQPVSTVWALSLGGDPQWTKLSPSGTSPVSRYGHTAIYDAARQRMIVFGGIRNGLTFNDVWALSLAGSPGWTRLTTSGGPPASRAYHSAVYDPVRDWMVIFGGFQAGEGELNDTWAFSLGDRSWIRLDAALLAKPQARQRHSAIYDPIRDRMVVFGGATPGPSPQNDTWALSLGEAPRWDSLGVTNPPERRRSHEAIYDPAADRMVVFAGGWSDNTPRNDVWALEMTGSAWFRLAPSDAGPSPRYSHAAIHDPARGRMVIHGGYGNAYLNDPWALSLGAIPVWTQLPVTGIQPPPRGHHAAIYDPVRDQLVFFGGYDGTQHRNDVWALSLGASPSWSQLAPAGTPPAPRSSAAAVYDPVSDRMLVLGGYDGAARRNDTWALSLSAAPAWTQLAPAGPAPSGRSNHAAVYDPTRQQAIVFGGDDGARRNDVWVLALAGTPSWVQLAPAGPLPGRRSGHTAIHDRARDRMVVFGGDSSGSFRNDVWALSLGPVPAWTQLAPDGIPPTQRTEHAAVYDPLWDRMVAFGGECQCGGPVWGGEVTWLLSWGATVGVEPRAGAGRLLWGIHPNPSSGRSCIEFELAGPAAVRATLYDVAGRRVRSLVEGSLPAGRHRAWWDGTNEDGVPAAAGIYFCRLATQGKSEVRRIALIR